MDRNGRKLHLPFSTAVTSDTVFSPCFSQTQASPITALSFSMGGLSCMGNTPKRRLSLSNIEETPPARTSFSRHSSQSSGVSTGTASPCESPVVEGDKSHPLDGQSIGGHYECNRPRGPFRRFNSMPLHLQQQDSPSFPLPPARRLRHLPREGSIAAHREEGGQSAEGQSWVGDKEGPREGGAGIEGGRGKEGLWMKIDGERKTDETKGEEDSKRLQLDDIPSPDEVGQSSLPAEGFTFVRPKPLSARAAPPRHHSFSFGSAADRPISAPASLLEEADEDDDDPIHLQHDLLTSSHDDDDGFSELFDSESQDGPAQGMSEGFAGLLHGTLIDQSTVRSPPGHLAALQPSTRHNVPHSSIDCNATRTTPSPVPRCRKGIFKVPSQPALLVRRNSSVLKRSERPQDTPSPVQNKRPRSSSIDSPQPARKERSSKLLGRSLSMMSPNDPHFQRIDQALSVDGAQNDLIGDRTKACCLPTVAGKQEDLKSIAPETMCRLLRSEFSGEIGECIIVDCRYPYEYNGGHIQGAINIYQEDELKRRYLDNPLGRLPGDRRRVFVFHCEFSSHRGPKLLRALRTLDRAANLENYPALYYPELYLLNEGYKAFYEHSTEFCVPKTYTPMAHEDHTSDLRHFRAKSKSWNGEKSRLKARSHTFC